MNKERRSTAKAVRIDPDIVLTVQDLIKTYTVGNSTITALPITHFFLLKRL